MGMLWKDGGYSADVEIYLRLGDRNLPISKIGPDSFVLREPCDIPPETSATIVMKIDGRVTEYEALLHNGVWHGIEEVAYI